MKMRLFGFINRIKETFQKRDNHNTIYNNNSILEEYGITNISIDDAKRFLSNKEGNERFFVKDGRTINNLSELIVFLRDIEHSHFSEHVSEEKNDFSNWIKDCIGDNELANEIKDSKNKYSMVLKIAKRHNDLNLILNNNNNSK
jgi:hypothetical protein